MAGASTSVYEFDSVIRGQHVYKSVWTSLTDWCSKTRKRIPDDQRDKYDKWSTVATYEREMQASNDISTNFP